MDTLQVKCPDCDAVLIVDKRSGKVLEVRRPIVDASSGDRFEDARRKVLGSRERTEQKVEEVKEKRRTRLDELDKLFKARTEELKDQPVERPDGLFDRD